jgi:hypothetical protein
MLAEPSPSFTFSPVGLRLLARRVWHGSEGSRDQGMTGTGKMLKSQI